MNLENKIINIAHKCELIYQIPTSYHCFIDAEEIDLECQEIGAEILKTHRSDVINLSSFDKNTAVFIITVLLKHGGGVRMLEDYIKIYQNFGMKCKIIVTELRESDPGIIKYFQNLGAEVIVFNDTKSYTKRIMELQNLLVEFRPWITFLFHFHSDFVATCGVQKELVNKLYLPLILDHNVSIGIHIPYLDKIIVGRPFMMNHLKNYVKISEEKLCYIPLSKNDTIGMDVALKRKYCVNRFITTASCASCVNKISNNFKYRFIDVILEILKITRGKHIHIGAITDDQLRFIRECMKLNNISQDRFIHIENTKGLAVCFLKNNVDVLIQTFPACGGLVPVEAMQAGLSIVSHKNSYSHILNTSDVLYQNAFFWQKPEELYNHFKNLKIIDIEKEGRISRLFYDEQLKNQDHFHTRDDIKGLAVDYIKVQNDFNDKVSIFDFFLACNKNHVKVNKDHFLLRFLKKIYVLNLATIFRKLKKSRRS